MPNREVVCVVEHNPEDRYSINRILSASGYLVKDYESGTAFLEELPVNRAACAIVDVRLPDMDVLAFTSGLSRSPRDIPYVMAASSQDIPLAMQAIKAGAVDYVEKPVSAGLMLVTVQRAIKTRSTDPEPDRHLSESRLIARLTPRERDVLALLLQGYQNKMIAYELGISQRTVEVYRARVMRRLNVSSFAELVRVAVENHFAANSPAAGGPPNH